MNRRDWIRRAAIIAGGAIAADQLELIERLTPRHYVSGLDFDKAEWPYENGYTSGGHFDFSPENPHYVNVVGEICASFAIIYNAKGQYAILDLSDKPSRRRKL